MLGINQSHRHTGAGKDGPKIDYRSLTNRPDTIACKAMLRADITVTNIGPTALTINSFETTDQGMAITDGRITIIKKGWYTILGGIEWGIPVSSSINRRGSLFINGTEVTYSVQPYESSFGYAVSNVHYIAELDVGDYVEIKAGVSAGWSCTVLKTKTFLSVKSK